MRNTLTRTLVMLRECFSMSLSNILGNRVRSFLTVLGILIGVTAVIALITTVSGFSGTLSSSFASMGAGSLSVSVTGSDLKAGMTTQVFGQARSIWIWAAVSLPLGRIQRKMLSLWREKRSSRA